MDVSPRMVVSVATAMIPFLENDDANRALMGANMQRQAVPLLKTEAPIVAPAWNTRLALTPASLSWREDGVVEAVSADEIRMKNDDGTTDAYHLIKFMRSNQGTCINQVPVVSRPAGEGRRCWPTAPPPATARSAWVRTPLIGFMTWEGYNYEDAVLLNEKIVREDVLHLHSHRGV